MAEESIFYGSYSPPSATRVTVEAAIEETPEEWIIRATARDTKTGEFRELSSFLKRTKYDRAAAECYSLQKAIDAAAGLATLAFERLDATRKGGA